MNEYISRWKLQPEDIMSRSRYMNLPENFDLNNNFHTCRGLSSYVENFRRLTMGVVPSASENTISTCSRLTSNTLDAEIRNLPVLDGYVSVKHTGCIVTKIENNTFQELVWRVAFMGSIHRLKLMEKVIRQILVRMCTEMYIKW